MLFWILGIIVVFALALSYGVVRSHKTKLATAKSVLREKMWQRHHRIPLLITLMQPGDAARKSVFAHLIALRTKLTNEHLTLLERIELEQIVTKVITDLSIASESEGDLAKNTQLIALRADLSTLHDEINRAISEYNFHLDKARAMLSLPWFKLYQFTVKIEGFRPLQGV